MIFSSMANNDIHKPAASVPFSQWVPFSKSTYFLFSNIRILGLSLLLFIITLGITWMFYEVSTYYVDQFIGSHFMKSPDTGSILGWIKHQSWTLFKWIFIIISRIISFYIAFLIAYCLTSPGYAFLSNSVEKIQSGIGRGEGVSLHGLTVDLLEGFKIGLFGIGVTCFALAVNFIPVIGQILVFLLYSYYSCLMFIDYPASSRRWSLGKKIKWLWEHSFSAFRLGFLPAVISMIPILNIFLMAFLFPLLTVHSTLNFSVLESCRDIQETK
jgi:CysZ protein